MATIRDVARIADVSIATVSRVLNGSSRVSDTTRQRVWDAAAELDYWPNGAAQSLTTRRANALGVLLPDLYGEFFSEVIRGIDRAASDAKHQILISSSHADTDAILAAARSMRGRIDGLIMMAPDEGSIEPIDRVASRFPIVLLNPRIRVEGCSSVSIANYDGAFAAANHLVGLGHREIALVKGPQGNVDAEERLRGYRQALGQADIEVRPQFELQGNFTESSGYRAAMEIVRLSPRPSAVFAANDSMAVGLLSAFSSLGIEVPRQMAVVGFDDTVIAQYITPPLTTVHVDAFRLGERAVQLLLSALRSPTGDDSAHEVLPAPIVVRESCGSGGLRPDFRQRADRLRAGRESG